MDKVDSSVNRTLLNENTKSWVVAACLLFVVLLVMYGLIWFWSPGSKTDEFLQDLGLILVGNIIPIPLLFAFAYFLLQPVREIRSEVERAELSSKVADEVQLRLTNNFYYATLRPDLIDIKTQIGEVTSLVGFSSVHMNLVHPHP